MTAKCDRIYVLSFLRRPSRLLQTQPLSPLNLTERLTPFTAERQQNPLFIVSPRLNLTPYFWIRAEPCYLTRYNKVNYDRLERCF